MVSQEKVKELEAIALKLRKHIIEMICAAASGHPGGSLSAADIFLQTSPIENIWATSLMEAMLMGKAIIATDVGYTSQYLRDREEVLLIEPKNPKKLAEAIVELSEKQELGTQMGKKCSDYALQEFDCNKIIDKIENIYLNL